MSYYSKDWYTIVRKHYALAFLYLIKFIFFLFIAFFLFFISIKYKEILWEDIVKFVFFPLVFVLINYSFIRLILWIIEYFNYLFIISGDQIFIINASLIMRDDIEVIEAFKIIKIDAYSRWFFANILWFWKIIIELQTREERIFRFMPKPYKLLKKLNEQREMVLQARKKKYIIDDIQESQNNKEINKYKNNI